MANDHTLTDAVTRAQTDLLINLNNLHDQNPDKAFDVYLDVLEKLEKYFKGSKPKLDKYD